MCYLERNGAEVMLEQRREQARQWVTGPLEAPFGRGINFQIEVTDVDACLERFIAAGGTPYMPTEEKWYRVGDREAGGTASRRLARHAF